MLVSPALPILQPRTTIPPPAPFALSTPPNLSTTPPLNQSRPLNHPLAPSVLAFILQPSPPLPFLPRLILLPLLFYPAFLVSVPTACCPSTATVRGIGSIRFLLRAVEVQCACEDGEEAEKYASFSKGGRAGLLVSVVRVVRGIVGAIGRGGRRGGGGAVSVRSVLVSGGHGRGGRPFHIYLPSASTSISCRKARCTIKILQKAGGCGTKSTTDVNNKNRFQPPPVYGPMHSISPCTALR